MQWDWSKLLNEILNHPVEGIVVAVAAALATWAARKTWSVITRIFLKHEELQRQIDALRNEVDRLSSRLSEL